MIVHDIMIPFFILITICWCKNVVVQRQTRPIVFREYFKEVSIEAKTIVETIENAQGFDFKKIETWWFQCCDSGFRSKP